MAVGTKRRKRDLTEAQAQHLDTRLSAPEHRHDEGPGRVWDTTGYQGNLFAVVETTTNVPIGAMYRVPRRPSARGRRFLVAG